ncbi:unnamed protein product, partial [Prorocentrum cordatum]
QDPAEAHPGERKAGPAAPRGPAPRGPVAPRGPAPNGPAAPRGPAPPGPEDPRGQAPRCPAPRSDGGKAAEVAEDGSTPSRPSESLAAENVKKGTSKAETFRDEAGENLKAQMEAASTAGGVAEIAFENIDRLTTEEIAEERPRSLSQLVWSLGKFRQRQHRTSPLPEHGIEDRVRHPRLRRAPRHERGDCSHLDLTNTLWGLARLYPDAGGSRASGTELAVAAAFQALVRGCIDKVAMLTPQCLANSFWAMGRLKVRGADVDRFVDRALKALASAAPLSSFTSQGLANVLWGLAQLRTIGVGRDPQDRTVRRAVVALVEASEGCLQNFQPQESSAWRRGPWRNSTLLARPRSGTSRGGGARACGHRRWTPCCSDSRRWRHGACTCSRTRAFPTSLGPWRSSISRGRRAGHGPRARLLRGSDQVRHQGALEILGAGNRQPPVGLRARGVPRDEPPGEGPEEGERADGRSVLGRRQCHDRAYE